MRSNAVRNEHHESFDAETTGSSSKRFKVVRQDRVLVENEKIYIDSNGNIIPVLDYSSFGLAVRWAKTDAFINELRGTLVYDDTEISELQLRLIRVEPIDSESIKLAYEIIGAPLETHIIEAIRMAKEAIIQQESFYQSSNVIPERFKILVYEMKDFLDNLRHLVDDIERRVYANGNRFAESYELAIAQSIGRYLAQKFPAKYAIASSLIKECDPEVTKLSVEFFRTKMAELIYSAPIVDRIYSKPLGYAGDYEMMNIIYKTSAEGKSLFEKCIHNYFVTDPAAQAVRNRSEYLFGLLKSKIEGSRNKPLKILSVAAGPAREIQLLIERGVIKSGSELDVYLLDQDETALKHAQYELRALCKRFDVDLKVNLLHYAIKNVIAKGLPHQDFDLIYSAGLFDYFSDAVAQIAASRLADGLLKGGELVLGNFNIANPSRPIMEIALDWKLIYRSDADLQRLFGHIGGAYRLERENLGINLFCVITK